MRIRTLLGIGTILLGTAGAFAARPHEEIRVQEPARIVQPMQEYRVDARRDVDRHDDRRDGDRRDFRAGHWDNYGHEVVITPACR